MYASFLTPFILALDRGFCYEEGEKRFGIKKIYGFKQR
jgi:hypothetical protein